MYSMMYMYAGRRGKSHVRASPFLRLVLALHNNGSKSPSQAALFLSQVINILECSRYYITHGSTFNRNPSRFLFLAAPKPSLRRNRLACSDFAVPRPLPSSINEATVYLACTEHIVDTCLDLPFGLTFSIIRGHSKDSRVGGSLCPWSVSPTWLGFLLSSF